ncbi:MAG: hypothetical protein ACKVOQ_01965 [Cyclobacteriaceae bacterium]
MIIKAMIAFLFTALITFSSIGQTIPVTVDAKTATLQERYVGMKKSSETFQDYKVIKEGILDGMWRVTLDSIKNHKAKFANANEVIAQLETEVATQKAAVAKIQASMETIVYDSTHISFFGINFTKSLFITLVLLIVVGQLVAIAAITGKLKLMYTSMKEKMETVNILSHEFEDYKKRALEKQVKLSRELQTERNKLMNFEPRGSSKSIL